MSASIESTFVFDPNPSSDARQEPEREHDVALAFRDGEERPAAQSLAEAHETPWDDGYVADGVI